MDEVESRPVLAEVGSNIPDNTREGKFDVWIDIEEKFQQSKMKIVSVTTFFPDSHSLNLRELHCFFISKTFVILTRRSWIVFSII